MPFEIPIRAFREPCMRPRGGGPDQGLSCPSGEQVHRSMLQPWECRASSNLPPPTDWRHFCIGRFCSQVSRSSTGFRSISPWQCQMRCRRRRTFPACLRDAGPNSWVHDACACVCAEKMQNLAESLSRSAAEQQVSVSMQSSRDVPRSTSEGGPWQSAGSSPAAAAADGRSKVALIFCAEVRQTEPALAGNEPAPAGSEQPKPPSAKALDGFHPIAEDRMPHHAPTVPIV